MALIKFESSKLLLWNVLLKCFCVINDS